MHTLKDFFSQNHTGCVTSQVVFWSGKTIQFGLALTLLVFFYGCESFIKRDVDSPFYKVPSGSTLILHSSDVAIPANRLKIYLQNGNLGYGTNRYYPFCKFELRQAKKQSQLITPDRFIITRTRRVVDYFVGLNLDSQHLFASISLKSSNNGKPSPRIYGTQMDLRSANQPQVFRLTCGHLQDPNITARHLSINQIREALGAVFTLQLAPEQITQE